MKPDVVTLHDRFAWQALVGLLARTETSPPNEWFARNAWDLADAMMHERELRMGVEAENAEREAREWVASAGCTVEIGAFGSVYVMGGGQIVGRGDELKTAVADAKAKLATDPAKLAPDATPAPSTPMTVDDEVWAREANVNIAALSGEWYAAYWDWKKGMSANAPTIAEAIRALRAKVEGDKL